MTPDPPSWKLDLAALTFGFVQIALLVGLAWSWDEHFFFRDDFQSYSFPGFYEMGRALSQGEMPLVTGLSWRCASLAGEFQTGVFSPVLAGCSLLIYAIDLPFSIQAHGLVLVHWWITFAGGYFLGRSYRLPRPLAHLAGLVAALHGWNLVFGTAWFPALASYAWLPWVWLAARMIVETGTWRRWLIAGGIFGALLIAAGWPFTVLHMALVLAVILLQALIGKGWRVAGRVAGLGVAAVGLAAPAWAMLLEYGSWTVRGQTTEWLNTRDIYMVSWTNWVGLLAPSIPDDRKYLEAGLQNGLAPWVLLILGLTSGRRFIRDNWDLVAILLSAALLCSLPNVHPFRWSFRWLPLVHLSAGLLAGQGAKTWLERPAQTRRRWLNPAPVFLVLLSACLAIAYFSDPNWMQRAGRFAILSLLLFLAWGLVDHFLVTPAARSWLAGGVVFAAVCSFLAIYPPSMGDVYRQRPNLVHPPHLQSDRLYLGLLYPQDFLKRTFVEVPSGAYGPGNLQFYAGVPMVQGYSPMHPLGVSVLFRMQEIPHGYISDRPPHPFLLLTGLNPTPRPGPLLARMAVDGLIFKPGSMPTDLPLEEFRQAGDLDTLEVWHRSERSAKVQVHTAARHADSPQAVWQIMQTDGTALPVVELPGGDGKTFQYAAAQVEVLEVSRHRIRARVYADGTGRPVLLHFATPWLPGYQARWNGENVPVLRMDTLMPAVTLPPGADGEVALVYAPASLTWGLVLLAATAAGLIGCGLFRRSGLRS